MPLANDQSHRIFKIILVIYTNPDINQLPDLTKAIDILKDLSDRFPVVHRGIFTPVVQGKEKFILTRTDEMYSLKPNITNQGALFGWCSCFKFNHPHCLRPSLFKDSHPNYLLNNVLREDFEIILESHPLYRLLRDGIPLNKLRRPLRVYNPYGLAHCYGFKSPFMSLSSSLDIAAFHACHTYDYKKNEFTPIEKESSTGLIYIFELGTQFSMIPNLSTVGLQPFARPGLNRLFVYMTRPNILFSNLPYVKGFQFRHSKESTMYYHKLFNGGASLYPHELLAMKTTELLRGHVFSEAAFKRNLETNPQDNREENLRKLYQAGYQIVKNRTLSFSSKEIRKLWFDNIADRWGEFWKNVVFPNLTAEQMRELEDLPNNPTFHKYFRQECWDKSNR